MPSTSDLMQSDPVVATWSDALPSITAAELLNGSPQRLATTVAAACQNPGFFCIDLDEGQRAVIANTLHQMQRFFDLDDGDAIKQSLRQGQHDFGWVPPFTEPAYQPGTVSTLEAFDCAREQFNMKDDPSAWPPLEGYRESIAECWALYSKISDSVLELIARAVGVSPDFLTTQCATQELNTMRLLRYPGVDRPQLAHEVGISAHTDFECITLLYQTESGLELLDSNDQWADLPPRDGRLIVLLGDMLERWTNGQVRATGHRVRNTRSTRNSIVMFVAVNDDVMVEPLTRFVAAGTAPRFAPITQEQHIDDEIARAKGQKNNGGASSAAVQSY
jgi:isopenicillin N synthase-like dioxygenase